MSGVRIPLPRPLLSGSLAQLVEQLAFNQLVAGSNPARPTTQDSDHPPLSNFLYLPFQSGTRPSARGLMLPSRSSVCRTTIVGRNWARVALRSRLGRRSYRRRARKSPYKERSDSACEFAGQGVGAPTPGRSGCAAAPPAPQKQQTRHEGGFVRSGSAALKAADPPEQSPRPRRTS